VDGYVQLGCYTLVRRRVLFGWIRQLATWQQPIPTPATQFWLVHNARMVGGYIIGRWCAGLYHYSHAVTSVGWRILVRNFLGPSLWAISACLLQPVMLCWHSFLNILSFLPPNLHPFLSAGHACCGDQNQAIHLSINICIDISFHRSIHEWIPKRLFLLLYWFKVVISVFSFIFVKSKFWLNSLHK
jgi:hypothetical protein